jgi:hypothetical protein
MATNPTADDGTDSDTNIGTEDLEMPDGEHIHNVARQYPMGAGALKGLLIPVVDGYRSLDDLEGDNDAAVREVLEADGQLGNTEEVTRAEPNPTPFATPQQAVEYQSQGERWRLDGALIEAVVDDSMGVSDVSVNVVDGDVLSYVVELDRGEWPESLTARLEAYGFSVRLGSFDEEFIRVRRTRPVGKGEYHEIDPDGSWLKIYHDLRERVFP